MINTVPCHLKYGISFPSHIYHQTKFVYKIGISCFSAKHAALRRKSIDWLARNQVNVCDLGDMSICRQLFQ